MTAVARTSIPPVIARSVSDAAIQAPLDCFASLAMTTSIPSVIAGSVSDAAIQAPGAIVTALVPRRRPGPRSAPRFISKSMRKNRRFAADWTPASAGERA